MFCPKSCKWGAESGAVSPMTPVFSVYLVQIAEDGWVWGGGGGGGGSSKTVPVFTELSISTEKKGQKGRTVHDIWERRWLNSTNWLQRLSVLPGWISFPFALLVSSHTSNTRRLSHAHVSVAVITQPVTY